MLLLGFLDYTGTIEIDGVNIATVPRQSLRSRLISASQEPVELEGTIRLNLLPYELPHSECEIESDRAVRIADEDATLEDLLTDLGIWEEIREKGGLYASLQNAGLSRVAIQTLCFARTVLRYHRSEGRLVLLDEATNGINVEDDAAVQKSIWEFFEGCSIVQIAHLEESIKDSQLSVEVSNGRIVHVRRGSELLSETQSRSQSSMPLDRSIISSGSKSTAPGCISFPDEQILVPDDATLSSNTQILPDIPALEPLSDDLVPPDELMLAFRDQMLSSKRKTPTNSSLVSPVAVGAPSMSRSAPSISTVSDRNRQPTTEYGQAWVASDAFSDLQPRSHHTSGFDAAFTANEENMISLSYLPDRNHGDTTVFGRISDPISSQRCAVDFIPKHSGSPRPLPTPNYSQTADHDPATDQVPDYRHPRPQASAANSCTMPQSGLLSNHNQKSDYGLRSRSPARSNTGDANNRSDRSTYHSDSKYEPDSVGNARMFH